MLSQLQVFGGDWPQILGPQRDGVADGETLQKEWPTDGPKLAWSSTVGQGFAGVAVRNDVAYVFQRIRNSEVLEARNTRKGNILWRKVFPRTYRGGISRDEGPRCVPTVTDTHVYIFGIAGDLRCLSVTDGDEVWHRDTTADFNIPESYFGAGSSPVLHDGKLIVNVGGRDESAVVAFSANDGSTLWKSFADTASYSSPIVTGSTGIDHALVITRNHMLSLDPDNGEVRFQFPFGMRGPTVNGATPVVIGHHVFVTSSYRVGSAWAKLAPAGAQPVLSGEDLLATQYATPIKHGELLFAIDGRQDVGQVSIKCIDPAQQQVLWSQDTPNYGTMIRVGDELLFLTCGGELIRINADRSGYQETQRAQVLRPTRDGYRLPALSKGRLYVRDDRILKCLKVGSTRR